MNNLEYYIWLAGGLGPANPRANSVLSVYDNPEELHRELTHGDRPRVPLTSGDMQRLKAMSLDYCREVIASCERLQLSIVTYHDERYPQRLRDIAASPVLLYVMGELPPLDECVTLGIVGTRRYSDYGKRATDYLAHDLARAGILIVSGLAEGIDGFAHRAALDAGGRTIGVVGGGLDLDFPLRHRELKQEVACNTCVVSEYPPGTKHLGPHFPQRNRIIAGLSSGVLICEAPKRSGALITAHCALEQGKDVFVVPGSIFSKNSEGGMTLLKEGAYPVDCAFDIIDFYTDTQGATLDVAHAMSASGSLAPLPVDASALAQRIYDILGSEPLSTDDLAAQCGCDARDALVALTELELSDCIVTHSGGRYSR